jgi:signal transduction histidine kinase
MSSGSSPEQGTRRLGLRARTALGFGLTALVLAGALAAIAYGFVRRSLLEDRAAAAMRQAYTDARLVRAGLRAAPNPDIAELLSGLQLGPADEAFLQRGGRWYSGTTLADPDILPTELRRGVSEGRAGRQTYRDEDGPRMAVGVPISANDAQYFEVRALDDVSRTLAVLGRALAIGGAAAAAIAAGVGALLSGRVLRPLRRMAAAAREIVVGDIDTRLDAEGDRDLVPLVAAFNEMLDDLRDRIRREARFASDVTHELRGPLATLSSAVAVVDRRRSELPAPAVAAIDALADQVRSFNQLVLDLLEISRFDAGAASLDRVSLRLDELVRSILADHTRDVELDARGPLPEVAVDRRRIHQVVTNLLENAQKYAGGAVLVALSAEGDRVRLCVEDEGPGIAEHERHTVFERFQRGSAAERPDAPRGTGLGLALVVEHVSLHGGRVWIEPREPRGSRFVVELPVER